MVSTKIVIPDFREELRKLSKLLWLHNLNFDSRQREGLTKSLNFRQQRMIFLIISFSDLSSNINYVK